MFPEGRQPLWPWPASLQRINEAEDCSRHPGLWFTFSGFTQAWVWFLGEPLSSLCNLGKPLVSLSSQFCVWNNWNNDMLLRSHDTPSQLLAHSREGERGCSSAWTYWSIRGGLTHSWDSFAISATTERKKRLSPKRCILDIAQQLCFFPWIIGHVNRELPRSFFQLR